VTTAYYARLYDQRGVVARIDRALTFLDLATDEAVVLEPDQLNFCTVYGPVPAYDTPAFVAAMRGQHDHLCCQMGG
jgi:hypothetical protein